MSCAAVEEAGAADTDSAGTAPYRVLVDTSVLAPEPLWLWLRAVRKRRKPALELVGTYGVKRELHPALRQIYREYDRGQLHEAARQRILSLTPLDTAGMEQVHRPWVLDPGDVHLDVAAVAAGLDAIVTDDVRAFAEHPERPYRVIRADEFLCEQTEDWTDEDFGAALDHYGMHRAKAVRKIGVEPASGSVSHLLRRSHARRFATRVMRAARRLGR